MEIMKDLKVLHVIDTLKIGGAERVLIDLCNILKQNSLDITVLLLVDSDQMSSQLNSEIPILRLYRKNRWSIISLFRVNAICNRYGIVHAHLRYNFRYIALAKLIFRGKYKLILHDHFGDIENDRRIPFGLKFFLEGNGWFVGVSQPLVNWAVERIGLNPAKCFLLPNIVVRKRINPQKRLPNSDLVKALIVANFRPSKNHIFAIKLLKSLRHKINIQITLLGQVVDKDYFESLQAEIQQCDLEDRILIRHDCDDVQSIVGEFDMAIHTAHQESGPLVLIEYIAQGLPFIAYKTGEVSTQLFERIPQFFMTNFEVPAWSNRIEYLLQHRIEYLGKMESAFTELYSTAKFYNRISSIYNNVVFS